MFRFTQEPSSWSKCQYLAKIADMVRRCWYTRTWSVWWRHMPSSYWPRSFGDHSYPVRHNCFETPKWETFARKLVQSPRKEGILFY